MIARMVVNQILFTFTRKVWASLCRILRNTLCSTIFYADLLYQTSPKFNGSHPVVFQYRGIFIYVYNTKKVV